MGHLPSLSLSSLTSQINHLPCQGSEVHLLAWFEVEEKGKEKESPWGTLDLAYHKNNSKNRGVKNRKERGSVERWSQHNTRGLENISGLGLDDDIGG